MSILSRAGKAMQAMLSAPHAREQVAQLLLQGRLAALEVRGKEKIASLKDVEFKVFSQFGDDGIIQWLVHRTGVSKDTFIEFGVEDYTESNTRFLMMNDNWSGLVIDGSARNINAIKRSDYYWRYDLEAKAAFIDAQNVNSLLDTRFGQQVGILSIDIDGNDYWVWNAIRVVDPVILIMEYNSVFGADRAITVPYDGGFMRSNAHYSNLYWGASLLALTKLSATKGYALVGCNSAGNNAYFVRRDHLNTYVVEQSPATAFVVSKFRESRSPTGELTAISGSARLDIVRGLPVFNVDTQAIEPL